MHKETTYFQVTDKTRKLRRYWSLDNNQVFHANADLGVQYEGGDDINIDTELPWRQGSCYLPILDQIVYRVSMGDINMEVYLFRPPRGCRKDVNRRIVYKRFIKDTWISRYIKGFDSGKTLALDIKRVVLDLIDIGVLIPHTGYKGWSDPNSLLKDFLAWMIRFIHQILYSCSQFEHFFTPTFKEVNKILSILDIPVDKNLLSLVLLRELYVPKGSGNPLEDLDGRIYCEVEKRYTRYDENRLSGRSMDPFIMAIMSKVLFKDTTTELSKFLQYLKMSHGSCHRPLCFTAAARGHCICERYCYSYISIWYNMIVKEFKELQQRVGFTKSDNYFGNGEHLYKHYPNYILGKARYKYQNKYSKYSSIRFSDNAWPPHYAVRIDGWKHPPPSAGFPQNILYDLEYPFHAAVSNSAKRVLQYIPVSLNSVVTLDFLLNSGSGYGVDDFKRAGVNPVNSKSVNPVHKGRDYPIPTALLLPKKHGDPVYVTTQTRNKKFVDSFGTITRRYESFNIIEISFTKYILSLYTDMYKVKSMLFNLPSK